MILCHRFIAHSWKGGKIDSHCSLRISLVLCICIKDVITKIETHEILLCIDFYACRPMANFPTAICYNDRWYYYCSLHVRQRLWQRQLRRRYGSVTVTAVLDTCVDCLCHRDRHWCRLLLYQTVTVVYHVSVLPLLILNLVSESYYLIQWCLLLFKSFWNFEMKDLLSVVDNEVYK